MAKIERVGRDEMTGRELFVVAVPSSAELPRDLRVTSPLFICLVAWNAKNASVDEIASLARRLLDAGAVCVCVWGQDCERVHDIVDEELGTTPPFERGALVLTTWHAGESLADALAFAMTAAVPASAPASACGSVVGVSIGSTAWADEMREAFSRSSAAH